MIKNLFGEKNCSLEFFFNYFLLKTYVPKIKINHIQGSERTRPSAQNVVKILLSSLKHRLKGSPTKFVGQLQIGLCITVLQRALCPQVPGHGSIHLIFWQALSNAHSELTIHSGLQCGGAFMLPSKQEQTGLSFCTRHTLYGPHGDGTHGFVLRWSSITKEM